MRTLEDEMRERKERAKRSGKPTRKEVSVSDSLRYSLRESGFFGAMLGFTQQFLVPFALLFGAGSFAVGVLTSLPNLVGSAVQLGAARLLSWFKRPKPYMVAFLTIQGVTWLLLPFLAMIENRAIALWLLILLVIVNATLSLLVNPVWMSYMGDLVPDRVRNKHFGSRDALSGGTTLVGTLLAGWFLTFFETNIYLAFGILFGVAALCRWSSTWYIACSRDLPAQLPSKRKFSIRTFMKKAPSSDFGRFVRQAVLMRFAVYLASPFFVVWQLRVLNFNYLQFTIVQASSAVAIFLSVRYWSLLADKRGNGYVLKITSLLICVAPFLWLVSGAFPFLIMAQFLNGTAWSGYLLASNNYMLESTSPKSRAHVIGYFNLFNNSFIFAGSVVGSILMGLSGMFSVSAGFPFMFVFATSALGRLILWVFHRNTIREVRFVQVSIKRKGTPLDFLSILPQHGPAMMTVDWSAEHVTSHLASANHHHREFKDFERIGRGKNVAARMKPKERELYRKQFIDRVKK